MLTDVSSFSSFFSLFFVVEDLADAEFAEKG